MTMIKSALLPLLLAPALVLAVAASAADPVPASEKQNAKEPAKLNKEDLKTKLTPTTPSTSAAMTYRLPDNLSPRKWPRVSFTPLLTTRAM